MAFELCRALRAQPQTELVPNLMASGLYDYGSVAVGYRRAPPTSSRSRSTDTSSSSTIACAEIRGGWNPAKLDEAFVQGQTEPDPFVTPREA